MHAASDGSFGRSAAGSTARGVVLLVIALGLGILLLQSTDRSPTLTTTPAAAPTTVPPTTVPPAPTSTTLPPTHDPKTVKVLTANGSNVNGLAQKTKEKVAAAGYDALSPVTATQKVTASQVWFVAGYQPDAAAIAALLGLPPTSVAPMPAKVPVPGVTTAHVVIMAGPDLAPLLTATTSTTAHKTTASTAKSTTATTAKPATSSTTAAPATTSTTKKP